LLGYACREGGSLEIVGVFVFVMERKGMKKISSYLKGYIPTYLIAIFSMITAIVLMMIYPQVVKEIINDVFLNGNINRLGILLLIIALISVGRCVCGYCKEYFFDRNSSLIIAQMRKDLFNHIQSLSLDYFDNTNTGELMARVKDDIDNVWNAFGFVSMLIMEISVHMVCVLYCMFTLSPKLTLVPMVVMLGCGGLAIWLERRLDKVYEEISQENAELTTVCEENLAGVRTVKAFARELFEIGKFTGHNERYYELNMKQSKVMVRYYPIFQFVGIMLPALATIIGGMEVINGRMDLGSLVAYVEYSRECTWPIEMVGWLTNSMSSAIASRKKIAKIYEQTSSIKQVDEPVKLDEVKGSIKFDKVSLVLGKTNVLDEVSFDVEAGQTLGIMGATGSGKSSIVNLIQRFYDPNSGSIYLDDTDISQMSIPQVRSSSAVVMQDVFLFSDTIEENIKMGRRDSMTLDEIKEAAHMAHADSFIESLESGYQTVIGERGVGLSGGQKQRISMARAFSKKAPVLILDDSTSALDMETEKEIQNTLDEVAGMTKIIVAHRVSAVKNADKIIYLDKGRVIEEGTHEELLNIKGRYYETFIAQGGLELKGGA